MTLQEGRDLALAPMILQEGRGLDLIPMSLQEEKDLDMTPMIQTSKKDQLPTLVTLLAVKALALVQLGKLPYSGCIGIR